MLLQYFIGNQVLIFWDVADCLFLPPYTYLLVFVLAKLADEFSLPFVVTHHLDKLLIN